nr:hypothetical protein GCM10025732_41350 [Glycomyces mayteni]
MGLDLLDGGVEVLGDLLHRGGPAQVQVGADRVEPLGDRVRHLEPLDGLEDRRRGVRLQFEPGADRGEAERHLVQVHRIAGPAEPLVRLRQRLVEPGRHLALDHRRGDDALHLGRDGVERFERRDARGLERLGGVEDPLGRVGVRPRGRRGGDRAHVRPPVRVGRAAQRPQPDQVRLLDLGAPDRQRPHRPVRSGLLDSEVEDRGVGERAALAVELLDVRAVPQDLAAVDHAPTVSAGPDTRAGKPPGRR